MFDIFSCENGPSRRYYQLHYAYHISQSVLPYYVSFNKTKKNRCFQYRCEGLILGRHYLSHLSGVLAYCSGEPCPNIWLWVILRYSKCGVDGILDKQPPHLSHWLPPTHCSFCGDLQPLNRHNTDSSHGLSSLRARVTCEVPKPRRTRSLSRLLWISCVGVLPSCL